MDFITVEGRTLKAALRPIVDVVERKSTIPILTYLRLSFSGSTLKIEGTDLDISVTTSIDVIDGEGEWSVCLEAQTVEGIASVAGVMPVRIERPAGVSDGENARIIMGDSDASYELPTLPVSDYPEILSSGFDAAIDKFTNGQLAVCLSKVDWCISTEETRYYLNGVFWEIGASGRRFVATDGHRLSACCYSPDPGNHPGYIIPRKTVAILTKHLAGKDVEVFGDLGKPTALEFRGGGFVIRSKMIDGTFPDWRRVVPQKSEFSFDVKRGEMIEAIKRSAPIARERGRAIRFHNHEGRIAIERKSPDNGDRLAMFARHGVMVKRLALNMDQVEEYNPPPNPAKDTDSRFEGYREQFGDESWELDALDPPVIEALIQEALDGIIDREKWDEVMLREDGNREMLAGVSNRWSDVVDWLRDNP